MFVQSSRNLQKQMPTCILGAQHLHSWHDVWFVNKTMFLIYVSCLSTLKLYQSTSFTIGETFNYNVVSRMYVFFYKLETNSTIQIYSFSFGHSIKKNNKPFWFQRQNPWRETLKIGQQYFWIPLANVTDKSKRKVYAKFEDNQ